MKFEATILGGVSYKFNKQKPVYKYISFICQSVLIIQWVTLFFSETKVSKSQTLVLRPKVWPET